MQTYGRIGTSIRRAEPRQSAGKYEITAINCFDTNLCCKFPLLTNFLPLLGENRLFFLLHSGVSKIWVRDNT